MAYPIEKKLVVGVSSNALFNLEKEDEIFKSEGILAYNKYQEQNKKNVLNKGLAFPFIKRFLNINKVYKLEQPVEVVLMSKNSPESGIRIFNSIKEHGLNVSRAAFTSGNPHFHYIPAFNISLFLSVSDADVLSAIEAGYAAGKFLKTEVSDDDNDNELRVAFDFDGVIADDQAEKVYNNTKNLELFHQHEIENIEIAHAPGPLANFFQKLSFFQKLENKKYEENDKYKKILRTAIVTARNAPSHERAINTLKDWGVTVDEMFLLGGIEKKRVLDIVKPHIYFDDQLIHLDPTLSKIPLVHIPFGIANKK